MKKLRQVHTLGVWWGIVLIFSLCALSLCAHIQRDVQPLHAEEQMQSLVGDELEVVLKKAIRIPSGRAWVVCTDRVYFFLPQDLESTIWKHLDEFLKSSIKERGL